MTKNKNLPTTFNVFSTMLLVGGTCIGGGMLAFPIETGVAGFFPSLLIMAICWAAMTATGLLLMEVSLWLKKGAHVITMSETFLGTLGKRIAWVLYLFISYASLVAYADGGGQQAASFFSYWLGISIGKNLGAVLVVLGFTSVIYVSGLFVERVNAILFGAMIAAYIGLVGFGIDEVNFDYLRFAKWQGAFKSIPLLLTAFSFQTMVPSLTPLLNQNPKALRTAIVGGTSIAFVVYALWQFVILGIIPVEGAQGLREAKEIGVPTTQFLSAHVQGVHLSWIANFFGFFALSTSFLGIGLGLFDFLADGLKLKKAGKNKLILAILIMVPTLYFATNFKRAFLVAMDVSGGFGDSILNGIMPILMVWIGRYILKMPKTYRLLGGKFALIALFAFYVFCLGLELILQLGLA